MIAPPNHPMEILKRNAIIFLLGLMALTTLIATLLHVLEPKSHLMSLVMAPLSSFIFFNLLFYHLRYPQRLYFVIKISLAWSAFMLLLPQYFFVVVAFVNPEKQLVDILPPIAPGLFLLTTSMIVFLRPRALVRIAFLLWIVTAAPIVIYLIFHRAELETPRGMDLIITLVPAMGINVTLLMFYSRLQDTIDNLYIERFHLKEISEKDALTNVFNRGAGEQILQKLIDQPGQKIGIILCDIDHFKRINDTFGHLSGDRVLQMIAHCCQSNLRTKDILIRWGGEEFLIVVTGDDLAELENLAQRLRRLIANQQITEVIKVTASFGVAFLQPHENLAQLFSRADLALYKAKDLGRNRVVLA
jgi:diguanylate cyclase (GGDEF)-like protein